MNLQRWAISAAAATAIGFLAGCGGNGASSLVPGSSGGGGAQAARTTTQFVIRVPHVKRHARGSRYVSPSTKSMKIVISTSPGGSIVQTIKQDLTPTTNGCKAVAGGTLCTVSVALKPAAYVALVDTYAATAEGGDVLSEGQSLPVTILPGKANTISLVMGGVPHEVVISHGGDAVHGSQAAGFKLYGTASQPFTVNSRDADGNLIVGDDSLHYTASVVSGSGWSVQATPNPATPNDFTVTPAGKTGSVANLKLTFNYSSTACGQSGAICSTSFDVTNDVQLLAVVDCEVSCAFSGSLDSVRIYQLPNVTTPIARVAGGVLNPLTTAIGSDGTLYVANCRTSCGFGGSDSVTVYKPPYTAVSATITSGVVYPTLLAVDSAGDLFVDDCGSCNFAGPDSVTEYAHGALTTLANTLPSTGQINAILTDPAGDLLMASCTTSCGYPGADAVQQFASPYTSSTSITNGVAQPTALAVDSAGSLLVANCSTCVTTPVYSVTKYVTPYSGASNPTVTVTGGGASIAPYVYVPQSVAADAANNLWVGNAPGGMTDQNVAEFPAPGYGGNGTRYLSGYQPYELRVDGFDDVIESSGDTVELSPLPYTAQQHVQETGIPTNQPFAISP
jgi:hypothetical protein